MLSFAEKISTASSNFYWQTGISIAIREASKHQQIANCLSLIADTVLPWQFGCEEGFPVHSRESQLDFSRLFHPIFDLNGSQNRYPLP
jgi:hypothetical protein